MSSLFDLLAAASCEGAGKAFGDEAFLEVIFDEVEAALLASPLRPAAALGGCQADACSHGTARLERVVATASVACVVACGPACGAPPALPSYDRVDVVVDPVLHQTDTGPFLIASDRRSGFGLVVATRRLDVRPSVWRAATHEVRWSFLPEVAASALQSLGVRAEALGHDPTPRALDSHEPSGTPVSARPRPRRPKPGASGAWRPDEGGASRDLELAIAGRLLGALQRSAELESALVWLTATLAAATGVAEALQETANIVGQALDVSRGVAAFDTSRSADDAPTDTLGISHVSGQEVQQGVYSRVDTRHLAAGRAERGESVVPRLLVPMAWDGQIFGELRLLDTRPDRVWTPVERRFAGRAAALAARALSRPFGPLRTGVSQDLDPMTGLERRHVLEARLEAAFNEADRSGEPVSLLRIEIEGLEEINETYGYTVGDAVLRHAAAALREQLAHDEDSLVARFSGDGFAVLLPGFTPLAAGRVADRLVEAITSEPLPDVGTIEVRAGTATYPDSASTPVELVARARHRLLDQPNGTK